MQPRARDHRKVTISLPQSLLDYADRKAANTEQSRSEIISQALLHSQQEELDALAAEGYELYAQEALEFARVAVAAAAEILPQEDWSDER